MSLDYFQAMLFMSCSFAFIVLSVYAAEQLLFTGTRSLTWVISLTTFMNALICGTFIFGLAAMGELVKTEVMQSLRSHESKFIKILFSHTGT